MIEVVGVRHHSPACARLVAATIERMRPAFVLVEGPSDMNARVDELLLDHQAPFAVFSYATAGDRTLSSWTPFCDYSPELVALREAKRIGARPLFIDLPAWDEAFRRVRNRYADHHLAVGARMEALRVRIGADDDDALWDHLFEQPSTIDELRERLRVYFDELRRDEPPSGRDLAREDFMARWIAWASKQGGDVVVVCGGYHKPALEKLHPKATPIDPNAPVSSRHGDSYLVPYSFHRLDAFSGYESGMPSPAFYQRVWEDGPDAAGEAMLHASIARLRAKRQPVSPADAIAAQSSARALQTLRGHAALARVDVLDGLSGAIVKDALEAPLPWSRRGTLLPRTEPALVEVVAAFSGDRVGKLDPKTPRPPLVADAFVQIEAVGIALVETPALLAISLRDENDRQKSRVLHRLRLLGIPGFTREPVANDRETREAWRVQRALDADAALIEAAAYGATLETAAAAKLEEIIEASRDLVALANALVEAIRIGADAALDVARSIREIAGNEASLGRLGEALARLLAVRRSQTASASASVDEAIVASFDRGLWLVEAMSSGAMHVGAPELRAMVALRDALRQGGLDRERALATMRRVAADASAPPGLRGAALGFAWSTGGYDDAAIAEAEAERAAKSSALPATFGDFLAGLFAVAREEVTGAPALLASLDGVIATFDEADFARAVPALRLAFSFFPPREKEAIARALVDLRGAPKGAISQIVAAGVEARAHAEGLALDAALKKTLARFGLGSS